MRKRKKMAMQESMELSEVDSGVSHKKQRVCNLNCHIGKPWQSLPGHGNVLRVCRLRDPASILGDRE